MNIRQFISNGKLYVKPSQKPGYLSIVHDINHFNLLGEKTTYKIDKRLLEKNYKELQKSIHPDKFSNSSQYKQMEFLSSYVNKAYTTLKDDHKRCVYMLKLEGVEIKESEKVFDPKQLETIIEINERIDEETYNLMSLKEDVMEKISELKESFNEAYESRNFIKAKEACILLSYYINIDYNIYHKINEN